VAGLAEKVQLPDDSSTAAKTVVTVEVKDEKPAALPPIPAGKQETLSVNVKLVAKIFANDTDTDPISTENVQPKSGKKVLVKLLLPSGFKLETLEIWHVKDSGSRSRISDFWLVTEPDGSYAVFEVSSFSHFVFFAEKVPVIDGGGTVTPPKPSIPSTEGGNTTITPPRPKPGTSVAVMPKPDEGYAVDKIVVTDQNGKEIPVKDNGDGTYSYIQPKGKVTIKVTYKPLGFPFTDVVADDWFYDSVKYVYEKGLMQGTAADKFSPYLDTDRGMIVAILWRLEGEPEAKSGGSFPDVPVGAYYAKAVDWAAENGIVKGYSSGRFGPDDLISREQLAAILYRYAQFKKMDASVKGNLSKFSDQPSEWSAESVGWTVGAGIISGKGNGILDPMGKATRAETAKILTNFADLPQK
ncbi:MAG: S-layer homology domain-containing protein, partial [Pseudoflavonifractor sp.]